MRNCPACDHFISRLVSGYDNGYNLHECLQCGMRYLDSPAASQARLDGYYANDKSPDLREPDSITRLEALATYVKQDHDLHPILDIGGKFSPLKDMLPLCATLNAGEQIQGDYGTVIMSHTLEHVYDVNGLFAQIGKHLLKRGRVIIEGPIWYTYGINGYDPYWQHVNKFRPQDLERLLQRHGYAVRNPQALPKFREFRCWRVEGYAG